MNKDWHAKNRMPKRATMDQRVRWDEKHARVCGCRPIAKTVSVSVGEGTATLIIPT